MPAVTTTLAAIAVGTTIAGAISGGKRRKKQKRAARRFAAQQAALFLRQATQVREQARELATDLRRRAELVATRGRAAAGKAGVEIGVGSAFAAKIRALEEGERDAERAIVSGERKATTLERQAQIAILGGQATAAQIPGFGETLLTGAGQVAQIAAGAFGQPTTAEDGAGRKRAPARALRPGELRGFGILRPGIGVQAP